MRFWFFTSKDGALIGSVECRDTSSAVRIAEDYNRTPGSIGPVGVVATSANPDEGDRIYIALPSPAVPESD